LQACMRLLVCLGHGAVFRGAYASGANEGALAALTDSAHKYNRRNPVRKLLNEKDFTIPSRNFY
jgi:hypothetical protein